MATVEGIRIDVDGILDRLMYNRYVEFVPDHPGGWAAIEAMNEASGLANDESPDMEAESPVVTLAGGAVALEHLTAEDLRGELVSWLSSYARHLHARGYSGEIRETPVVGLPQWYWSWAAPQVTAFTAFEGQFAAPWILEADTQQGMLGGPCPPAVAAWLEESVRWAARSGGIGLVGSGGINQIAPGEGIAEHLYRSLEPSSIANIDYIDEATHRVAHAGFVSSGYALYQENNPVSPMAAAARMRQIILANANATRLAFVAMPVGQAFGWADRARALPSLPTIEAPKMQHNNPIWRRYVPDAHCIQLLTAEHMANVADLSAWTVTDAPGGHFLVETPDLEAWLRPGGPEESLVSQARIDFGHAIVPADALR